MPASVSIARINRLPDNLVNRIAAGEVIERPASVVKELMENSLDAGATHIDVDVEHAGSRLLRITDNGYGIHIDDLVLALERHTTSKLQQDADLMRIATLGFRGEALSSIASVSRLTLASRWRDSGAAWTVTLPQAGNDVSVKPAAHPPGTTVEVRDLFYNTPARRKFLRSEKTEFLHIQELIKRVALGRYDLKLRLQHNNRRVLQYADDSHNPLRRVQAILGNQFAAKAIVINERSNSMSLSGWIGPADYSRSQSDQQFVYLNGRIIRDKLVNHAIRLAYQDFIHPGRQPVYVLYLDMDLAAVDINVHPTKHEVRFRETRMVHDFIYGSLVRHLTPRRHPGMDSVEPEPGRQGGQMHGQSSAALSAAQVHERNTQYNAGTMHSLLRGRFILAERANRLLLMNVYRARIVLARHKLCRAVEEGTIIAQPVLVPLVYKGDRQGCEYLMAYSAQLADLAIEIVQVSPTSVQIRSLPRRLPYADILALVDDLLPVLKKSPADAKLQWSLLETMALHANDLAPANIPYPEMTALLDEYFSELAQLPAGECRGIVRELDVRTLSEFMQRGH